MRNLMVVPGIHLPVPHLLLPLVLSGLLLLPQDVSGSDKLLNIDFGVQFVSQKLGPAAIGHSPEDYWNLYTRDDGAGGYRTYGELNDLLWADSSASEIDLTVVNAPGAWGNGSSDPMFGTYLYPNYGESITINLQNLPAGNYVLYVYAHGALDGENGVAQVAANGQTWGPISGSTSGDWSSPSWENGHHYLRFDTISVGFDGGLSLTITPGATGLAVINGVQLLKNAVRPFPTLINVDFSSDRNAAVLRKTGPAAIGNSDEDFWNLYSRDGAGGEWLSLGTLDNLLTAEGAATGARMSVLNAPGLWISEHPDAMLHSYLYPHNGGEILITLSDVSPGTYDLLFYSHGYLDGETADVEVRLGEQSFGRKTTAVTADWRNLPWQEGVQYLRFSDLPIGELPVQIIARPGTTGLAIINGFQLVRDSDCLLPTDMVAWWRGEGDGKDAAGLNHGEVRNGLGFAEGLVGEAFAFSAWGQHLWVPASESMAADSFTMEAWINPDPARLAEQQPLFEFADETGPAGAHLWISVAPGGGFAYAGTLYANLRPLTTGENVMIVTEPGVIAGGDWSHVALTYDAASGMASLFVNGALATSSELGQLVPQTRTSLYLGHRPINSADGGGGYTFGGKIDEPAFYPRALSASEIAAIHAAGSHGKCKPQGHMLAVTATTGGTVMRNPDAPSYKQGEQVTLTALPEQGFAFHHWQGDVCGSEPEVVLVMDGPKQVRAVFVDVAAPTIVVESPLAGVTETGTFVLSGSVTDNQSVSSVYWALNGQSLGWLPVLEGRFYVDGLQWVLGENIVRIEAVDIAGNQAVVEVVVTWAPARLLAVVNPAPRQEGLRIEVPIQLSSSGDVGAASFVLRYNPSFLKQPSLDWSQSVRSALNQVNTEIPGEVRATFALPATTVPSGNRNLAVVTFRSRSVPEDLQTALQLELLDISNAGGNSIISGSAVRSGEATILVRRMIGDNNANQRLDVGDATLIQRLLAGIDPVRFWDRTGNDVNQNSLLDSGDVIRVLRAVVKLDPQPQSSGAAQMANGAVPMNSDTAGAVILEADRLRAEPGELVTVGVKFPAVTESIAALSLNLEYPADALKLLNTQSHRVGGTVPGSAVAVWNVAPAQNDYVLQSGAVSLAVSSALSWDYSNDAIAEFIFQVQAGQSAQYRWPIRVSHAEVSADGYDMAELSEATLYFVGRDPVQPMIEPGSVEVGEQGFGFSFQGEPGVQYIIETSNDLEEWTRLDTRDGSSGLITILDPAALSSAHRFYRVRSE